MGNAVEFKPHRGAYALAAKRMGKRRQSIERAYKSGSNADVMAAVAKASVDLKEIEAAKRREYWNAVKRQEKIVNEINEMPCTHD